MEDINLASVVALTILFFIIFNILVKFYIKYKYENEFINLVVEDSEGKTITIRAKRKYVLMYCLIEREISIKALTGDFSNETKG